MMPYLIALLYLNAYISTFVYSHLDIIHNTNDKTQVSGDWDQSIARQTNAHHMQLLYMHV